jgi:transposase-like protein
MALLDGTVWPTTPVKQPSAARSLGLGRPGRFYEEKDDNLIRKAFSKNQIGSGAQLRHTVRKLCKQLNRSTGSIRDRARKLDVFPLKLGRQSRKSKGASVTGDFRPTYAEHELVDTSASDSNDESPDDAKSQHSARKLNRWTPSEERQLRDSFVRLIQCGTSGKAAMRLIAGELNRSYVAIEKRLRQVHGMSATTVRADVASGSAAGSDRDGSVASADGSSTASDSDEDSSRSPAADTEGTKRRIWSREDVQQLAQGYERKKRAGLSKAEAMRQLASRLGRTFHAVQDKLYRCRQRGSPPLGGTDASKNKKNGRKASEPPHTNRSITCDSSSEASEESSCGTAALTEITGARKRKFWSPEEEARLTAAHADMTRAGMRRSDAVRRLAAQLDRSISAVEHKLFYPPALHSAPRTGASGVVVPRNSVDARHTSAPLGSARQSPQNYGRDEAARSPTSDAEHSSDSDTADSQPTQPGAFTPAEDELLWNAYICNSEHPTTAPGPFNFPPGYVSELAGILGRHPNAVNRRLRELREEKRLLESDGESDD